MKLFTKALLSSALLLFAACTDKSETVETATASAVSVEKQTIQNDSEKKLLFFINPNGHPCQIQDQILKDMGSSLTDNAELEYIPTTDMKNSRPLFMQYGVRALPTLILLNGDGSVNRRFTPGIIDAETISSALN